MNHLTSKVHTLLHKQNQLKYMHQSCFRPPIAMIIHVMQNDQLEEISFMKDDLVQKYLTPLPAIPKCWRRCPRASMYRTWKKKQGQKGKELKQPPPISILMPNKLYHDTHPNQVTEHTKQTISSVLLLWPTNKMALCTPM